MASCSVATEPTDNRHASAQTTKPCCFRRFRNEFSLGFFAEESIDFNKSFRAGSSPVILLLKLGLLAWSVTSVIKAFVDHSQPQFYIAYLTAWGVIYCSLYFVGSFLIAARPATESNKATPLIKFTWVFFSIAAVHGIIITLMYWLFVYSGRVVVYNNVMIHGGVWLLVLLDGLVINRVPVRIKHMLVTVSLAGLYMIWSVIQNVVWRYNPVLDDDDDALYDVMKWRTKTTKAVILALLVLFVGMPLFTTILWWMSLPGRIYVTNEPSTKVAGAVAQKDSEEIDPETPQAERSEVEGA